MKLFFKIIESQQHKNTHSFSISKLYKINIDIKKLFKNNIIVYDHKSIHAHFLPT